MKDRCAGRAILMAIMAGSAASVTTAQSLSTTIQNNGTGGVFMDLTPGATPLNFNSFATYWTGTDTIEVWTRPGTYVGFDASSAGWTQSQVITGQIGAGTATLATVTLTTPIVLPANQTTAVYLQPTTGGGFNYTGTGAAIQTTWSNADLTLFSDVARTGLVVFGGTRNTPRCFAGTINYSPGALPGDPGACCLNNGTCADGTYGSCVAAGGVFKGVNSLCSGVTCPAPVACCKSDGTCSNVPPAVCTQQGGSAQAAGTSCGSFNCNGACCNPDGTCTSVSPASCVGAGGVFNGVNTLCGGVTCTPFFGEIEPNDSKAQATPVVLASSGQVITGTTTGTATTGGAPGINTSQDTFRVKTPAAPLGIYRHRLVITTNGTVGHTGTIRGLTQTGSVINAGTDVAAQTSSTATTPPRYVQWYGFGKQEEIYFRVTGAAATTAQYIATYDTQAVAPTDAGSFVEGSMTIARGTGNTWDADFWVYDSTLTAVANLGNDAANTLTATLAPGVYYIAWAPANLANELPAPAGDTQGTVLDFPNAASSSSTTTTANAAISITDVTGPRETALSRTTLFEFPWVKFTVTAAGPGACCLVDGTCSQLSPSGCAGVAGVFGGVGVACGAVTCAPAGSCCLSDGTCLSRTSTACNTAGGIWGGAGSACGPCSGACCLLDGSCAVLSAVTCRTENGFYGGNGSACASANCPTLYSYSGGPVQIIGSATTGVCAAVASATVTVADSFTITGSVDASYWIPHTFQGDLKIALTHVDTATTVVMVDRPGVPATTTGFGNDNYGNGAALGSPTFAYFRSTDTAPNIYDAPAVVAPGTTNVSGQWKSESPLAAFLGQNSAGTWRLDVQDCAAGDTGSIQQFILSLGRPAAATCYPNCDNSTQAPVLNVADFTCFLQKFAASDPYANCDNSTQAPILNVADFTCFLQKFAAGCS